MKITDTLSKDELLRILRQEPYAVQTSVSPLGAPQAALVGVVVTDDFELFFDTLTTSRKAANMRTTPRVAFVLGPTAAGALRTIQYEGIAGEPSGDELTKLLDLYFARFPDGKLRQGLPDIAYFRVKPVWLRCSDFSIDPPRITEFQF